jgi:hypothetical protein
LGASLPHFRVSTKVDAIHHMLLHLVPMVLGKGIRLFPSNGVVPIRFRLVSVERSADVTDLRLEVDAQVVA